MGLIAPGAQQAAAAAARAVGTRPRTTLAWVRLRDSLARRGRSTPLIQQEAGEPGSKGSSRRHQVHSLTPFLVQCRGLG